jgi:hypothetical protein
MSSRFIGVKFAALAGRLAGTPVQNNLEEFFQMIDFVNPGVLGTLSTFNNIFTKAIDASRDKNAKRDAKVIGESRSAEVSEWRHGLQHDTGSSLLGFSATHTCSATVWVFASSFPPPRVSSHLHTAAVCVSDLIGFVWTARVLDVSVRTASQRVAADEVPSGAAGVRRLLQAHPSAAGALRSPHSGREAVLWRLDSGACDAGVGKAWCCQ